MEEHCSRLEREREERREEESKAPAVFRVLAWRTKERGATLRRETRAGRKKGKGRREEGNE